MNTAQVIPFKKLLQSKQGAGGNMYSDKFQQGYVMSSLLYRKEVYPFLSDAARNVYAELENRINGYNKESDFVSYSQLQGGDLPGSRKLGRTTVSDGLKELIKLEVITIISSGKQGMKSYRINEISIKDRFTSKTSTATRLVSPQDQDQSGGETTTSPVTGHTIDSSLDLDINKKKNFPVDNLNSELFSNSIEYHREDRELYTFRELANVYTIKLDFTNQAKNLNSKLTDDLILADLKNFAQWTTTREKTTAQGWMNYWIYRIQKSSQPKAKTENKPKSAPGTKKLSDSQVDMFSKKLCNHHEFASMYSNAGETQKQFETRISMKLREAKNLTAWASYLNDVGFVGKVEDFV